MTGLGHSARSKVTPAKAAAVFGFALGAKGERVDVVGFANGTFRHRVRKGAAAIREVERFLERIGEVGHGTDIGDALRRSYAGHDRVFIIADRQTVSGPFGPHRHEFGGLTDATFRMIPLLEAGRTADWPF